MKLRFEVEVSYTPVNNNDRTDLEEVLVGEAITRIQLDAASILAEYVYEENALAVGIGPIEQLPDESPNSTE